MAKIKKYKNTIRENIFKNQMQSVLATAFFGLTVYTFYRIQLIPVYYSIILIPFLLLYIKKQAVKISQLKSGLKGETEVLKLLKKLPKDFYVLANKKAFLKGKEQEFDYIVISPKGITIVEVKNYVGTLVGSINDLDWIQKKFIKGKEFNKIIKNPIKQIDRQENYLKQIFKNLNYRISIKSILYFNNHKTSFNLKGWDNRIISQRDELINALKNDNDTNLSKKELKQIFKYLSKTKNYQ